MNEIKIFGSLSVVTLNRKKNTEDFWIRKLKHCKDQITRGSKELVIAHLVFNLTSKVDRKWGCYT
jgi:hypothetical protein